MIRAVTAALLLTAPTAIAEEAKAPPKITYLVCTEKVSPTPKETSESAADQAPAAATKLPHVASYAFTETELFIDGGDLDKDSVKITPNAITWTESSGEFGTSISRVTGNMYAWVKGSTTGGTQYECVVVDKAKF